APWGSAPCASAAAGPAPAGAGGWAAAFSASAGGASPPEHPGHSKQHRLSRVSRGTNEQQSRDGSKAIGASPDLHEGARRLRLSADKVSLPALPQSSHFAQNNRN